MIANTALRHPPCDAMCMEHLEGTTEFEAALWIEGECAQAQSAAARATLMINDGAIMGSHFGLPTLLVPFAGGRGTWFAMKGGAFDSTENLRVGGSAASKAAKTCGGAFGSATMRSRPRSCDRS